VGGIVLFFIAVGVVTSLISGSVLFVLIKESFITGLVGLVFLSSFLRKRPIMFYFARQIGAGDDAQRLAYWDQLWERPRFRHVMRTMTMVWGVGYVVEAIARVIVALIFTPGIVVIISPVMAIGTTLALILWTRSYGRAAYERGQREAALAGTAPAA
ncbi:MAG TPA: VC0807 family protein, partial [Candidatus Binataceae bacterium]|nr:VC0807 family protein [Candidatus Binataceae bacterium]